MLGFEPFISECRDEIAAAGFFDVFLDRFGLENFDEFLIGRIIFVRFAGRDDIYVRARIVLDGEGCLGVETGGAGVTGVDDGNRRVVKRARELRRFELDDLEIVFVFRDVERCRFGRGDAFGNLDQALFLQKQERAAAVGRVIGDADGGAFGEIRDVLNFMRIDAQRCEVGAADGNKIRAALFIERVEEGAVLHRVQIDVARGERLVRRDVIGEDLDFHGEVLLGRFFGDEFQNFFRIARRRADRDFRFLRGRRFLFFAAAAGRQSQNRRCAKGAGQNLCEFHEKPPCSQ